MTIIIIMLLGLVLRVISVNQSLWLDEATTAMVAKMSLGDIFGKFLPGDFHPPLYYLFMKYWGDIFGTSEVALRVPSIIFGLVTIYLVYLIGKHLYSEKVGLIASVLLATSGLAIYYSQEARMYSLAALLASLTVYMFLRKRWLSFSFSLALLGMTDYVALFILPIFFVFGIKKKNLLYSLIPLLVSFLAWQSVFLKQLAVGFAVKESIPGWWKTLGVLSVKNILLIPIKFVIGRIGFDNQLVYLLIIIISLSIFTYLVIQGIKSAKLLLWWLVFPILLGITISLKIPTLTYFRFLFCLPALYLLIAHGISKLSGRKFILFLSLVLLINLGSSFYYLLNNKFHREDWRSLVSFVEGKKTANSITIFLANSNMEAYRYYAPNARISSPAELRQGYDQVWVMVYLSDIFDRNNNVRSKVGNLGYKYVGQYNFNGVGILEYSQSK